MTKVSRILAVRLGSMGDVIHTLPAVASLKHSFPGCHLAWVVDPKWAPLLAGNPYLDEVILFDRRKLGALWRVWNQLRNASFDLVVDFQGLIKSALLASVAKPEQIHGFHRTQVRERLAALVYSHQTLCRQAHIVDQNIELAMAAGSANVVRAFPLPQGIPEGRLPREDFVLASPFAGWRSKQWPRAHYVRFAELLGARLGLPLVINGPPQEAGSVASFTGCRPHTSGIEGLIDATRRARAVIGIDSGPLHLAAALEKPGVAIFGPTNPERNGPYSGSFTVLRHVSAKTTYKRREHLEECMWRVTPEEVCDALCRRLEATAARAGGAA